MCWLFKVGLPDEKGEHCEVKKEEKIEPSKYTDVLIQIQHSVNVHYTTHNIPSQDAGFGLGIGEGFISLVNSRCKWKNFAGGKDLSWLWGNFFDEFAMHCFWISSCVQIRIISHSII